MHKSKGDCDMIGCPICNDQPIAKPSRDVSIDEIKEYFELYDAHYLRDELHKDGEPYPGRRLNRLFELDAKYRPLDKRTIIFDGYDALAKECAELKRELSEASEMIDVWESRSEINGNLAMKLQDERDQAIKERDELLTAMAVVKQKFKADCELNEDTANLWLKVLNENTFLHQELDQALSQAAALAGALEGLTNAALAELKPLPSQTELGFDALAKYREFLKGRESDE